MRTMCFDLFFKTFFLLWCWVRGAPSPHPLQRHREVTLDAPLLMLSSRLTKLNQVKLKAIGHDKASIYNKTISDGCITVDFWIIKVHTSN